MTILLHDIKRALNELLYLDESKEKYKENVEIVEKFKKLMLEKFGPREQSTFIKLGFDKNGEEVARRGMCQGKERVDEKWLVVQ